MDRERLASWGKGSLVVILIAQLLGLLIIFRSESPDTPPDQASQAPPAQDEPESPDDDSETPESTDESRVANEDTSEPRFSGTHVSSDGGYRFRYPLGWDLQEAGTATEITSLDGNAKVTFGLAPAGDLRSASQRTVAIIQDQQGDVIVTELNSYRIGRLRARLADGKATNSQNVRLLFRSVTVAGTRDTFAILAFEAAESSDSPMAGEIADIIQSFREIRSGSGNLSSAPHEDANVFALRSGL